MFKDIDLNMVSAYFMNNSEKSGKKYSQLP